MVAITAKCRLHGTRALELEQRVSKELEALLAGRRQH
jgi:hypothetical protein